MIILEAGTIKMNSKLSNYEFFLYIKLVPIIFLLILGYWIKGFLGLSWLNFIFVAILSLILFRYTDIYVNDIFNLSNIIIVNIAIAIICYIILQWGAFKLLKLR